MGVAAALAAALAMDRGKGPVAAFFMAVATHLRYSVIAPSGTISTRTVRLEIALKLQED
jgi:hypothetical protein